MVRSFHLLTSVRKYISNVFEHPYFGVVISELLNIDKLTICHLVGDYFAVLIHVQTNASVSEMSKNAWLIDSATARCHLDFVKKQMSLLGEYNTKYKCHFNFHLLLPSFCLVL